MIMHSSRLHTWQLVIIATMIAMLQIVFAIAVQSRGIRSAYFRLYQNDSQHYDSIATHGYRGVVPDSIDQSNYKHWNNIDNTEAGFFPGYPIAAWIVHVVTGIRSRLALLLVAQFFAIVAWSYFLLILHRWNISLIGMIVATLSLLAFPSSFFLVAGYSESLFLAGVLGFLYWSEDQRRIAPLVAALHGVAMTGTRIIGVAMLPYSAIRQISLKGIIISIGGAAGIATYFFYLQLRFHHWNLYFLHQYVSWRVAPDFLFFRKPLQLLFPSHVSGDINYHSQIAVSLLLWIFILIPIAELVRGDGWKHRAPLFLCAIFLFFIPAAGVANIGMQSMIRYVIPPLFLCILWAAQFLSTMKRNWIVLAMILCLAIASFIIQAHFIYRFSDGQWIATHIAVPIDNHSTGA
jgi:hypothetical protein